MKLIPYFAITGNASYPDESKLFSNMSKINFNSSDYWLCDYAGELELETGNDNYESYEAATNTKPDEFTTANEAVTINGNPVAGFQSVYFGVNGDTANMTFHIVDDQGALQTQLDSVSLGYPPVLALPVLKVVNGDDSNVVDEVYFATTLVEGIITVAGSFPASGNWKITTARINAALAEIGAAWVIEKDDVTFRINS